MSKGTARRFARERRTITRAEIEESKAMMLRERKPRPILSSNLTCGVSVNVSIAHTCTPAAGEGASKLCATACYAKAGLLGMRQGIRKSMAVYELIQEMPLAWLADKIHRDYRPHARRLHGRLRINAAGDLFPRQVELLNYMIDHAERYPLIERFYLYTKRPSLLNQLRHRPDKLAAFVSLDASNPQLSQLVRWPWAQAAWMQTVKDEAIPAFVPARTPLGQIPVTVVFPDHDLLHLLSTTDRTCAKLRPREEGGIAMELACAVCTHCSEDPRTILTPARVAA